MLVSSLGENGTSHSAILKKNDELSKVNYRPPTVLSAINITYEKILVVQLCNLYTFTLSVFARVRAM